MIAKLITKIHSAGGFIETVAGQLRLKAPKPLPDQLVADIRRHKTQILELRELAGDDWSDLQNDPDLIEVFAQAVVIRRMRSTGQRPPHYTQPAHCTFCGPIWLWAGAPPHVEGCLWCLNRAAGTPIPRP